MIGEYAIAGKAKPRVSPNLLSANVFWLIPNLAERCSMAAIDRQTDRDKHTDRRTNNNRGTDRQTDRETDRQTDRHRQTDRRTDTDRQTEREREGESERKAGRQTGRMENLARAARNPCKCQCLRLWRCLRSTTDGAASTDCIRWGPAFPMLHCDSPRAGFPNRVE